MIDVFEEGDHILIRSKDITIEEYDEIKDLKQQVLRRKIGNEKRKIQELCFYDLKDQWKEW